MLDETAVYQLPRALDTYPLAGGTIAAELTARVRLEPFNAVATGIFLLAIVHTFTAWRFTALAHALQLRHDRDAQARERPSQSSVAAEVLHFFGEVEVVFGLWAVVLIGAMATYAGWEPTKHYVNDTVNYTEPLFVVVIMAMASTRPIVAFAESTLRRIASIWQSSPGAWWVAILTIGPLLGSLITEPAAMTICALLLARQFYDLHPSMPLKYATLGILFVNISIGGTLTPFAAPPVLIVARPWAWDLPFMLATFGGRAIIAIVLSTALYYVVFRREFRDIAARTPEPDVEQPDEPSTGQRLLPVTGWVVAVHAAFMAWTVFSAHYPVLFVGGFLFFLGFTRATAAYQSRIDLKTPLLVGFFFAGLVIHGGLQGWWIEPLLRRLAEAPLFFGAAALTAFNDNALVTYLATLVPHLGDELKVAVVHGAVVGGGLTVIANAPNPAGQALLGRFFDGAISPVRLLAGALPPTIIAATIFRLL
jgi:hypothetical protein